VSQPWYADDAEAGAGFTDILAFFERLKETGPHYGYYPEACYKSILVICKDNLEAATEYFSLQQFEVPCDYWQTISRRLHRGPRGAG
jgi:hypothetical protein